ncbi:tRNA-guanine(15) transglycosylase-like protein [Trametes gibbosa]|nr:tRNA-guanine(15) transglycosylase-like protein [Trametes gibbosa]
MAVRPLFTPASALSNKFGPRIGTLSIHRDDSVVPHETETPALLAASSRGIIPHLSRDHLHISHAIQHIQLPFESFINRNPPVPTLVDGLHPLHTFLGYSPDRHLLTMTLRDPSDGRRMPPNGNESVSAHCTRGVRKVTASAWNSWVHKCRPDIVVALSDTPFTPPPHSQKRLTKSIERSIAWVSSMLRVPAVSPDANPGTASRPKYILLHLAGGANLDARTEFAERLTDPIEHRDAVELAPFNTLDDGIAGYVFDLLPLRSAIAAESRPTVDEADLAGGLLRVSDRQRSTPNFSARLSEMLQASLQVLPPEKPRVLNSPASPHEVLRLVRDVGVDLVDSFWAQRAADMGIALDFRFPLPNPAVLSPSTFSTPRRQDGKMDLGHNLFAQIYVHDHVRLASSFLDGLSASQSKEISSDPVCECGACSPLSPSSRIPHSTVDTQAWQDSMCPTSPDKMQPPFTRAYVHHLLHTHEMSAHALLAMHNISVFSAFLAGIRSVLARDDPEADFAREVSRFEETYDEELGLWDEAEVMWLKVERARGKGRLAREGNKQIQSTIGPGADI